MKKTLLAALLAGLAVQGFAQGFLDIQRYSVTRQGGTARSMGMGGAIGAVGNDYSASSVNPAALAQIRTSQVMGSVGLNFTGNTSNYLSADTKDSRFNFSLPNMGVVFSTVLSDLGKERKEGLVNYSFAFGYNRINDFNRNMTAEGENNQSSYLDFLAEEAGRYIDFATASQSFYPFYPEELALAAGAVIYDQQTNAYYANLPNVVNMRQNYRWQQSGRQADWNLSWAGNFSHRLYVGAGVAVPGLRFNSTETITEKSVDANVNPDRSFILTNNTYTSGTGFNAKLGMVFRAADWFRIGAAYQTPTTYRLNDQFSYSFVARNFPQGNFQYRSGETLQSEAAEYKYSFTTPGRATLSAAFVHKKIATLSVDYEYVDYKQAQTSTADLSFINRLVQQNMQATSNIRIGGEYNYYDYRIRAGYALYASPFKKVILDQIKEGNLALRVYSLGFGYQDPNSPIFFDMAFVYERYDDYYTPYTLETTNRPYYSAFNKVNSFRCLFTLGTKF